MISKMVRKPPSVANALSMNMYSTLGLDVALLQQVLHGQQFDLFTRPIADVARLLHRSQTHGGSADAAGAGEGRFRGTATRHDETQERASRSASKTL